jgi:penicillin-binding protein 1A
MFTLGKISKEEQDNALAEKLEFVVHNAEGAATSKQSYFVDQLIKDVTDDLIKQKGYSESYAQNLLYTRGLKIYSTMDSEVQKQIDEVFVNNANFPNIKSGTETPQAAMVVINPKTGDVVGLVGGKGPKEADMILNRSAAPTFRQPGSCMKPIAVYAPALEAGIISPAQVVEDSAIRIEKDGTPWPKNYTGTYSGPMTIKRALSNSINTVAVKVLQMLGSDSSFDFLTTKLGITSLVKKQTINGKVFTDITDSLALGGLTKGVSVMELTAAYQIFPNHGIYNQPRTYTRVETIDGKLLLEKNMDSSYAISSQTAFVTHQFLSEVMQSGTGTSWKLNTVPTAGKTGTTTEDKDRWFVGYSPYYVAGVWFGYDQPRALPSGIANPSGKLFKLTMDKIHAVKKLSGGEFEVPAGVTQVQVCMDTGLLATANCISAGRADTVWFDNSKIPTTVCTKHSPQPTSGTATSSAESSTESSTSSSSNNSSSNVNSSPSTSSN